MFFRQLILKPSLEFHGNTNIRPCVYNLVVQFANYVPRYDINDFCGINHITVRFSLNLRLYICFNYKLVNNTFRYIAFQLEERKG